MSINLQEFPGYDEIHDFFSTGRSHGEKTDRQLANAEYCAEKHPTDDRNLEWARSFFADEVREWAAL